MFVNAVFIFSHCKSTAFTQGEKLIIPKREGEFS